MSRGRARVGAVAATWVVGLGLAAVALHWAGRGALSPPPLGDPGRWPAWLDGRDPTVAAFSLLRLVTLTALGYLTVATALGAALRVAGAASLVRAADRVTIGPVRRLLAGGVSLGLAASGVTAVVGPALASPLLAVQQSTTSTMSSSTTAPASSATAPPDRTPATPAGPTATPATPAGPTTTPATITMRRLGPAEMPVPVVPSLAPAAPVVVAPAGADRWTVRPGECFWSIADRVLAERWGRPPTDAEIVPYWQRLIEANRHELAQRDNPDLIFPGQVFSIPR